MRLKAFGDNILCINGDLGDQKTEAGIIIKSNLKQGQGITARWFQVFEVGSDIDYLESGDWVLVSYGRWTEHFRFTDERLGKEEKIWKVEPEGCLAKAKEKPNTLYYNTDKVASVNKTL